MKEITAEEVVKLAKKCSCEGVAWTYNEPTIWHEFTYDSSKLAKKKGLYVVYVSNGYMQEEPLREISPYLDAINIDVKAFTDSFYKKVCKAHLQPVLDTCVLVKELDIHLEVTYLIIPGYNDSLDEIKQFCSWVVEKLGINTPVHFSRFHPDFEMINVPRTPMETMIKAYGIACDSGLLYTYLGNVSHGEYENTVCPKCKNICIERHGFSINLDGIKNGKCMQCGASIPIVF
jgi:pyruvate formate lyase activating enzyme